MSFNGSFGRHESIGEDVSDVGEVGGRSGRSDAVDQICRQVRANSIGSKGLLGDRRNPDVESGLSYSSRKRGEVEDDGRG